MKRTLIIASLFFALAACEKKEEAKTEDPAKNAATTSAASAAVTATATATAQEVAIKDEDIATPADFEEAAEKSIDAKNYKSELATLEKDIAKE